MTMRQTYSSYEPATRSALAASDDFIEKMESWTQSRRSAEKKLRDACASLAGGNRPTSFISKDALNMSVFGVLFDKAPAKGFLPAPSLVAVAAKSAGMKGIAYIPDVKTEEGRSIFKLMTNLSSVCEQRPLLRIKGVQGLRLEGRQLMLASAVKTDDGVRVYANPRSVSKSAELVAVKPSPISAAPAATNAKSVTPGIFQRPSPFNQND